MGSFGVRRTPPTALDTASVAGPGAIVQTSGRAGLGFASEVRAPPGRPCSAGVRRAHAGPRSGRSRPGPPTQPRCRIRMFVFRSHARGPPTRPRVRPRGAASSAGSLAPRPPGAERVLRPAAVRAPAPAGGAAPPADAPAARRGPDRGPGPARRRHRPGVRAASCPRGRAVRAGAPQPRDTLGLLARRLLCDAAGRGLAARPAPRVGADRGRAAPPAPRPQALARPAAATRPDPLPRRVAVAAPAHGRPRAPGGRPGSARRRRAGAAPRRGAGPPGPDPAQEPAARGRSLPGVAPGDPAAAADPHQRGRRRAAPAADWLH